MLLNAGSQRGRGASLNKASLAHRTISNIVYIVNNFIYKCTENIDLSKVKCLQIFQTILNVYLKISQPVLISQMLANITDNILA